MWTCVNEHDVRDGMFVCPRCGADQVADPDRPAAPPPVPDRDEVRVAARSEIANRATAGVGLVLLALVLSAASAAVAGTDAGPVAVLLLLAAYLTGLAGVALVLVGVVGHGVRLGVDAAGSARSDGGAGQA